jgi:GAF domain-containing protein
MKTPPVSADEIHRQDALSSLHLVDTPSEAEFDAVVQLGRALFGVPICLISLIDKNRQWFKACVGLDARETSRDISFCGHAILGEDVFVIPDAREDERFHDNPLVTGAPFIRFYAGAPIRLPSGYTIGTVCVISPEPRTEFSADERARLMALAGFALNAIALRALRADLDRTRASADRSLAVLQALPVPIALLDAEGRIHNANEAFGRICSADPQGQEITSLLPATADAFAAAQNQGTGSVTLPSGRILTIMADTAGYAVIGESTSDEA